MAPLPLTAYVGTGVTGMFLSNTVFVIATIIFVAEVILAWPR